MDDKKPKKRKPTQKRAEQNRVAQKAFRERKMKEFQELKQKAEEAEAEKRSKEELIMQLQQCQSRIAFLEQENAGLYHERESMIHVMDRLRSDNMVLQNDNARLRRQEPKPKPMTKLPKPVFIKGGAGQYAVMRPPFERRGDHRIALTPKPIDSSAKSSKSSSGYGSTESEEVQPSNPHFMPQWTPPSTPQPNDSLVGDYHLHFSYTQQSFSSHPHQLAPISSSSCSYSS